MVHPHYPEGQPPVVPWPMDYDEYAQRPGRRNGALTASIAGLIAVLVLAVGVLLGLQLTKPHQASSPPPSVGATAAEPVPVSPAAEPPVRDTERERASEAQRLDRNTYRSVSPREFALLAKDPDAWAGHKVVVYGVVTQFDAATGTTAFRANTGPAPSPDPYDYDQNTFVSAHDAAMVRNVVEDDVVKMFVEVQGAYTYDTQIGGSTTVPALLVHIIETAGAPPSAPPAVPSRTYVPAPSSSEPASADRLTVLAAADGPLVVAQQAERWVPQLSSKRVGMVAEGRTWTSAAILAEHEQLRQRYPGTRLLWSGDWSVFSDADYWVTIAGAGFPTAEGALAWCTGNGFDSDHCYAKLISRTHGVPGSTAYNR